MRQGFREGLRRRRVRLLAGGLVVGGMVGGVGVAGAAQQAAEEPVAVQSSNTFDPTPVEVATGDTVVWDWAPAAGIAHNVRGTAGAPEDPNWVNSNSGFLTSGQYRYTFTQPGTYAYVCDAHAGMTGSVEVEGEPVEPTPTPSPTVAPTVTPPAPTPGPSGSPPPPAHDPTRTPPPSGTAGADRTAPAVTALRAVTARRGAKLTFKLNEPATVTLRFSKRGSRKVARTVRLQARPGTRTVSGRGAGLRRGRYSVAVQARDASGNTTAALRTQLRVKRK